MAEQVRHNDLLHERQMHAREVDRWKAEAERLREENEALGHLASEEARLRGVAEGKLQASEWAGVIDGWKAEVVRLRAEKQRLWDALYDIDVEYGADEPRLRSFIASLEHEA